MPRVDQLVAPARAAISNANRPGHRGGHAPGSWVRGWLARVVVGLLVASAPAIAQPVACDPVELGFTGGTAGDSVIRGTTALVANGGTGLLVLDVSDPAAPREVARLDLPGYATIIEETVAPDGGRIVFVGVWVDDGEPGTGIYLIDVTDPDSPSLIGVFDEGRRTWDLRVVGSILHACQGPDGLATFDISDPRDPVVLSRIDTGGYTTTLDIAGDTVFVADFVAGLVSIDMADPSNPAVLATASEPIRAFSVVTRDGFAYVCAEGPRSPGDDAGIFTFDVQDPSQPTRLNEFYVRYPLYLSLEGEHLYFSNHIFGLKVYGLADPTRPALLGEIDLENAFKTEVVGGVAYVSDLWVGLVAVDVTDPTSPSSLGEYRQTRRGYGAVAMGDYLYNGNEVFDVSDPMWPTLVGRLDFEIYDVAVDGDRAVAAGDYGMHVMDFGDPARPIELGFGAPSSGGYASGVALDGNIAYLCGPDLDFEVLCFLRSFDISDPTSPVLLDEIEFVASGTDVATHEGYLYFAAGSLLVLDAGDPADLRFVSQERGVWITDVVVRDGLLYASGPSSLRVYDLATPEVPMLVGEATGFGGYGNLVLDGDLAYLSAGVAGVHVIDIGDATTPSLVLTLPFADTVRAVDVLDGTLAIAAGAEGLRLYDVANCRACLADVDGDGDLTIFDFLAFQDLFAAGDPKADFDGDGSFTIFDFLVFQNAFEAGCE